MDYKILYKYLNNTATDTEMHQVLDWLDDDPAHHRELDEIDRAMILSLLHHDEIANRRAGKLRRSVWHQTAVYAAQTAAVLAIGFGLSYILLKKKLDDWSSQMAAIEIPDGNCLNMKLQDGTTVWLNAGTRMEYPLVFSGRERRVKISGEAIFTVEPDADRPFVVETFACDVEVFGTEFDITAEEQNGTFSTAVFNGSVQVINRLTPGEKFILQSDDEVRLVGQRLTARRLDNRDAYLWTEGILCFTDVSFAELMRKFEKSFGVRIVIDRKVMPVIGYNHAKVRISDGVDSALRLLQKGCDFKYTHNLNDGTIVIR